ncbi:CBM35 domain-containing protein [Streptomyces sp. NPDC091292]|uniref:CBM35 domain-containing protein n=1 Tax=Streptomyces sp. NPDC091292 TaxID=3365991 RepID=UPI00381A0586
MTAGNNGASTPEDDDPFGYLYEDGRAAGATPPSGGGGYGYPGPRSYNQVRPVGERQYGQQAQQAQQAPPGYGQAPTAAYGQQGQQQYGQQGQQQYGQPHPQYAAPETQPGGHQPGGPGAGFGAAQGGGRGRGPNHKGLLIGAVAVVAVVVVGIVVAITTSGGGDDKKTGDQAGSTPSTATSDKPTEKATEKAQTPGELPKIDAKALKFAGGTTTASDIEGASADGGVYVAGFNQVGASVTWTVDDIPKAGKYTLNIGYGVPGKDANATLTVNGTAQTNPLGLKNWAGAPEGDYVKGWTKSYAYIELNKGTNTLMVSCAEGNQCDANLDQFWLEEGWKNN